jgi:DNA-binding CsgD family transcriptional regulator
VSSRIWDKVKPLTTTERAQVELHPWHTEQVLSRVPELSDAARVAAQHHERLDGSGYHRGAVAAQLSVPARALAAADRYRGLVEERPHRPATSGEAAAATLRDDVRRGLLDPDAVEAVLAAAGLPRRARRSLPGGLTRRQVDVVRLLAAGRSNREIAAELVISPRTAEHHVQDVYARIGVATRAGAALYAMEHGLLDREHG